MKIFTIASIALIVAAGDVTARPMQDYSASSESRQVLSFDDVVALAEKKMVPRSPVDAADLRGVRLPYVRVEVTGNASRTLDLFTEAPYESRYATSVLAFDYPLWDGGAMSSRIEALTRRLQRVDGAIDELHFTRLLDAFTELHVVQAHEKLVRPLYQQLAADASPERLDSGSVSNLTAADRRETMLAFEGRLLDLEVRRIDAVTRLRSLTGLEEEPLVAVELPAAEVVPAPVQDELIQDDLVEAATLALAEAEARLREVTATAGFRALLSGFAGVGSAQSEVNERSDSGSYGIYGLRINLSYPLVRGAGLVPLTEARAEVGRAQRARQLALDQARTRAADYLLREESLRKRIVLLEESIETSTAREESLQRLVAAGMRSENELAHARVERVRRELDLVAARADRWKVMRLLDRMSGRSRRGPDHP